MTPLKISILIHYAVNVGDYGNLDAPAIKEAIADFHDLGLLHPANEQEAKQKWVGNDDALKIYLDALEAVPLPTMKWTI